MELLLDTQAVLWWLADDTQLGSKARALIERGDNTVFVSAASVWEIEIKRAIGKLSAPDDLTQAIEASYFTPLPVAFAHATAAGRLPRHHDDPFDRMLIGQAIVEQATLITPDRAFHQYELALLPADSCL